MRFLLILPVIFTIIIFNTVGQNLDKVRLLCLDEVNLEEYNGELSKKQLQEQVAALGFRYIENGEIKYHQELIVYNCNTGEVQFTANFDENRLVKSFVLYESEGIPSKKIRFSKKPTSSQVDLKLNYKGQEISSFPTGKTEIYNNGKLVKTISFDPNGDLPLVTNYNINGQKTSEGPASISGYIQETWSINKLGKWKYFNNGQLLSSSVFDQGGNLQKETQYVEGKLSEENTFLADGTTNIKTFYSNSSTKSQGSLDEEVRIGTWKFYDDKGVMEKKIEYKEGQEIEKLTFNKQENIIEKIELVDDHLEKPKFFEKGDRLYTVKTFFANGNPKSKGYQIGGSKAGIFEYFNAEGNLSEIVEYDRIGKKLNSVDAETYEAIQESEKKIYRELLVAKTTHPINLRLLNRIELLTDRLTIDFDSLLMGYEYKQDYKDKYTDFSEKTSAFGQLSNSLNWYDSLVSATAVFNSEVWAYSHDLHETELALEKLKALETMQSLKFDLEKQYTSSKKTLFGEKTVVINDQEEIYEVITEEIYPSFTESVKEADNKYGAAYTVNQFDELLEKGSMIIEHPNKDFRKALENTDSVKDKKKLFLSIK